MRIEPGSGLEWGGKQTVPRGPVVCGSRGCTRASHGRSQKVWGVLLNEKLGITV